MAPEKRLLRVTAANLKHSHLYITGHRDFFPPDIFGGPKRKIGQAAGIEIVFDGLNETATTDIGTDDTKPCFTISSKMIQWPQQ